MSLPRVAMVFTGGTIAMRDEGAGNRPTLDPERLLRSVPEIGAIADVEPIDWGLIPASHLRFEQVLSIGRAVAEVLARPEIAGAVVVQGTDVIEETAFAWDLLPLPPKPVVVTGAMRSASQAEYDGPANLRDAIAAAADPALAGRGVSVVMAGEINAADDVRKTHTHAHTTFASPNTGRLGSVSGGVVRLERERRRAQLPRIPDQAALPVHILTYALDADPTLRSVESPLPAGLVVAAAGGGNTPPEYLEVARRLMARDVPVALTTRSPSGQPMPGYAFDGGSTQWWEARALFSGTLGPLKTRVLMALAIGDGLSADDIARLLAVFGGGRDGV